MSSIPSHPTELPAGGHDGDHAHPAHLAHHFDTPDQQYASGKLGMWVFLGTELLMFGGLFCAYAVFRHNHPEVFEYAHVYLNKWWGAVNTVVLLVSSFTMAWAVRCAQLGKKSPLCLLLALTILGGAGFMCIKYIEYKSKWEHHLFPGMLNVFNKDFSGNRAESIGHLEADHDGGHSAAPAGGADASHAAPAAAHAEPTAAAASHAPEAAAVPATADPAVVAGPPLYFDPNSGSGDAAKIVGAAIGPTGTAEQIQHGGHGDWGYQALPDRDKVRVNTFFSIYFMMTGLHGIHVVVGMGLIGWVLFKASTGVFGPAYYTPVDLVGLYWHLVDLIWIFLFPLLYLIH